MALERDPEGRAKGGTTGMILRVLRARVVEGEEARLARYVRDEAIARALTIPGLLSFQPAVREAAGGTELVIVSTWAGFDDMVAAGRDLDAPLDSPSDPRTAGGRVAPVDAPLLLPGARPMLADVRTQHHELVIGEARAMPLHRARLRLTRIPIRRNLEAKYYDAVRRWAEHLLDDTGLVAFTLGRRVVGQQDEVVAIQIWQDEEALREAAGTDVDRPMGGRELSEFWAAPPEIEHFDALTAVEPRKDAPAILVADDHRRYVHATPAAARLSGRPLARLLTMRVDDVARPSERPLLPDAWNRFLAEGSMEGPYVLARPDGSDVEVRYASKANVPWPGSHASLLVPTSDEDDGELDVDRALVEAGFVARYPAA